MARIEHGRRRQPRKRGAILLWILIPGILAATLAISTVLFFVLSKQDGEPIAPAPARFVQPAVKRPDREPRKIELIEPAILSMPLGINGAFIHDIVTNGPANTHAVVYVRDFRVRPPTEIFYVYELTKGSQIARLELVQAMKMDLSPDGTRLAILTGRVVGPVNSFGIGDVVREVGVWSLPDGKLLETWNPYPEDANSRNRRELTWVILISSEKVLTISREGQFDLWDIATRKKLASAPLNAPYLVHVAITPFVGVWTLPPVSRAPRTLLHVAISPDRKTLAVFHKDRFDLFDTSNLRVVGKTEALTDPQVIMPGPVAFSPDGKRLAFRYSANVPRVPRKDALACWSVASGKRLSAVAIPREFLSGSSLAFWGSNHVAIWDSFPSQAKIYDLSTGKLCRNCKIRGGRGVLQSHDGRLWYATAEALRGPTYIASVGFPNNDLKNFPPQPNDPRCWNLMPSGITPKTGP